MGRDAAVGGLSAPDAAAAAARVEARLRGIRAALVSAQLALAEQGRAAFAALEPPGHASVAAERPRPTLELFARLTARCAEELREELAARARALRELAADGGGGAAAAAELDARGGDAASAEFAAAAAAAAAAAPSGYAVGSLFGEDPSRGAGRAAATAAAVGARERGARALVVTVEAALELILGRVWAFRPPEMGGAEGGTETTYAMAEVETVAAALAPAVATLAELDDAAGGAPRARGWVSRAAWEETREDFACWCVGRGIRSSPPRRANTRAARRRSSPRGAGSSRPKEPPRGRRPPGSRATSEDEENVWERRRRRG